MLSAGPAMNQEICSLEIDGDHPRKLGICLIFGGNRWGKISLKGKLTCFVGQNRLDETSLKGNLS